MANGEPWLRRRASCKYCFVQRSKAAIRGGERRRTKPAVSRAAMHCNADVRILLTEARDGAATMRVGARVSKTKAGESEDDRRSQLVAAARSGSEYGL